MPAAYHVSAAALGSVTPKSENAPLGRRVLGGNGEISTVNFPLSDESAQATDELGLAELAELQRRFHALGIGLFQLQDESLLITRLGVCRILRSLGSARAFLATLEGAQWAN